MKFRLYWDIKDPKTGEQKTEIVEGDNIADAFTHAGYGAGAMRALDWYGPIDKEGEECPSQ